MAPPFLFWGFFMVDYALVPVLNGRFLSKADPGPVGTQRPRVAESLPDSQVAVDRRPGDPGEASYSGHGEPFGREQDDLTMETEHRTAGRIGGPAQPQTIFAGNIKFHGQNPEKAEQGLPKV